MKSILNKLRITKSQEEIDREVEELASKKIKELMSSEDFDELVVDQARKLIRDKNRELIEKKEREEREKAERIEKAKTDIETFSDHMKESDEPYVNLRSLDFDPKNGIKVDIDWNVAFIKYLKANGISGSSEEETVRIWLAHLSNDISTMSSVEQYMSSDDVSDRPDKDILNSFYTEENDENQPDN